MKNRIRRIIAVLLAVVMVLCAVPAAGFAEIDLSGVADWFSTTAQAYSEGYLTYTVENGKATITDCDTSISGSLSIPSTLGGYLVTSIDGRAFSGCTGLTSVTIPDSVTSIGRDAFYRCTGLTSITIPDSVASIGYDAFYNTSWYSSQPNGIVYAGKVLYEYKGTMPENASIDIPEGTKGIASSAFYGCTGLTSITIPESLTNIGYSAFRGCTGLKKINWNAENISDFDINDCIFQNAESAGEGIDVIFGDNVKKIPAYAFCGVSNLKSIIIGNNVTDIGNRAFYGCTGLTSITIPDSVTSIGDDAFRGCTGLTSVTIGNSVTSIDVAVFEDCTSLTKINWNAENVSNCGGAVFSNAGTEGDGIDVVFGDSVKIIPAGLFYCYYVKPKIKSVTIGNSVTSIGGSAFCGCTGLTSVTIPDSVTSIGGSAFSGCTGLTSVTIPDSVTSIGNYAFRNCTGLTSVTIGNSVTSIGYEAFRGCTGLKSVTIPDSVTSIGGWAFSDCAGLTKINWNAENASDLNNYNNIFYNAGTADDGIEVVFGNSVKTIPADLFYSSYDYTTPNIKSVTIGNSVTSIGDAAFMDCTGLTSVTIGNSVTSIGNSAFKGCIGLTSITIPDSVKSIGKCAFYRCTGLTSVTIGNSVTSIGYRAFYSCTGLTNITIGNSVTNIGDGAFMDCTSLKDIYYSGTSKEWEKIKGCYFPSNVTVHSTSSGSGGSSGDTDPKDDTYDNYEDKEKIEEELGNYSVIIGKMDSFIMGIDTDTASTFVGMVVVDGTRYPIAKNVLPAYKAKMLSGKNVFIAVREGTVEWIDKVDSYVGEPYIEVKQPQYSYRETEGLKCVSSSKNIIFEIVYPFQNRNMTPAPGTTTSIFNTNAFYEMLSHEFLKCDLYDLSVSEVKVKSEDSNLKLSNSDIFTSTDKDTLKVCESVEYEIPTQISSSLTVSDDAASKKLSFYVEAKTSNGTLKERGEVTVKNSNYRSNDKPWEHKPSSDGSQPDNDNLARKAGNILNNIPISLYGDISGSLYELFTKEQLESIAAVIYTEVAMYKAPKESFTDSLSTKIIEKVFKCKTNLLSFGQNEISLTFAVDTKWGEVKVEFTTKSNDLGLNGSNYAFYGTINYKIVGGKAEKKLPKNIAKSGFAGGLSGVDMEAFCKAVWAVAQGQLKSSYNKAYGDDLNKAANIIFGESVNKVLKHTKYKSVSGLMWKLLTIPSTEIKIECPVDVFIYDSDNKLVASFINDKMTSNSENVCLSIVDGAKIVQLFDDGYRIEYRPFAEGKMNITTEEYAFSDSLLNRTFIKDVPLSVGVTYKQQIDGSYIEDSDYSLVSNKGEKYDADEYSTVFHTHVSDGIIYHSDESTCTLRGAEYKYCIICNDYYSDLLSLLEHIDKNTDGKCDRCGEKMTVPVDPPKPDDPYATCTHICHKGGISAFFYKIARFFWKLFKTNKYCSCGAAHY